MAFEPVELRATAASDGVVRITFGQGVVEFPRASAELGFWQRRRPNIQPQPPQSSPPVASAPPVPPRPNPADDPAVMYMISPSSKGDGAAEVLEMDLRDFGHLTLSGVNELADSIALVPWSSAGILRASVLNQSVAGQLTAKLTATMGSNAPKLVHELAAAAESTGLASSL